MRSPDFWRWFDKIAGPHLIHRTKGFRRVFDYLDRFDRPIGIVETGCVRQRDNWVGDGQSTILFDRYAEFHPGSAVFRSTAILRPRPFAAPWSASGSTSTSATAYST